MNNNSISIKKAAIINAIAKYSNVVFMLIANVILSRILSVEDYGVYAIITVFVTFFSIFSDFGLSSGIIQNKKLNDKDFDNIYSFTIYLGLLLCIIFWGIGYLVSVFYVNTVYVPIGFLLSISVFFNTANMIPNAVLLRKKQFLRIAIRTICAYIFSYLCAIIMALKGFSFYSLVFQSIISSVITFIWNYSTTKLKFVFKPSYCSIKKIISYSTYTFSYDILNYFGRNLDNILTGKIMGEKPLGYYNKAYQLMLYPINYFTNIITPVLHPILSDYQDNKEIIYEKYIKILKILSLTGIMFSIFCFFLSKEIILILYGKKWLVSASCVSILSVSIWFQMTSSTCTSIFKSLGDMKLRLKSGIIYLSIQIVLIIMGAISKKITVLSIFVSISFIIRFFIEYYYLIKKAFKMSYFKFLSIFKSDIIIGIILFGIMFSIKGFVINNVFVSFAIKGIVCCISFIILLIITKQINYFLLIMPKKLKRKFGKYE